MVGLTNYITFGVCLVVSEQSCATFTLELRRTNLLSPNLPRRRFSSGPRLCDPGAVAFHRKLTDMKRESEIPNKAARPSRLERVSASISFKDHNQNTE